MIFFIMNIRNYLFCFLFAFCLIVSGCSSKTINGAEINDSQCKTLLDWIVSSNPDTTYPYFLKSQNFDVFYSKKFDTCVSTFNKYEKSNSTEVSWYIINDELDIDNWCMFQWNNSLNGWWVMCHWKFKKIVNEKDWYEYFDTEVEVTEFYNKLLEKLK